MAPKTVVKCGLLQSSFTTIELLPAIFMSCLILANTDCKLYDSRVLVSLIRIIVCPIVAFNERNYHKIMIVNKLWIKYIFYEIPNSIISD